MNFSAANRRTLKHTAQLQSMGELAETSRSEDGGGGQIF